jgi:hypothetical protein
LNGIEATNVTFLCLSLNWLILTSNGTLIFYKMWHIRLLFQCKVVKYNASTYVPFMSGPNSTHFSYTMFGLALNEGYGFNAIRNWCSHEVNSLCALWLKSSDSNWTLKNILIGSNGSNSPAITRYLTARNLYHWMSLSCVSMHILLWYYKINIWNWYLKLV